eukprot:12414204-Karenia_brevis.AAC.1
MLCRRSQASSLSSRFSKHTSLPRREKQAQRGTCPRQIASLTLQARADACCVRDGESRDEARDGARVDF